MNVETLTQIKNRFTYPPENWKRLVFWWKTNSPISFYSWECPPRQIQEDPKYGQWVNFDLDLTSIVKGKKLDEYTELPRLTIQPEKESWFIKTVLKQFPRATYTKIIADTNATYLFIKSRTILGDEKIIKLSEKFRRLLKKEAQNLLGKDAPAVILFTKIQEAFQTEYDLFFNLVLKSFKGIQSPIVPQKTTQAWVDCLINHIGLARKDKRECFDVLKRVIASYAAEGMIFELASQSEALPNPVWVNWEEEPKLAQTTDLLRKRWGLEPIPKIYFVKK